MIPYGLPRRNTTDYKERNCSRKIRSHRVRLFFKKIARRAAIAQIKEELLNA